MAFEGLQTPNLTSRLVGKNVLIIGCSHGPKSMDILRICRNTGAVLYVATCPLGYEKVNALLQKEDVYIQQGIHFLIVSSMERNMETKIMRYPREQVISDVVQCACTIPRLIETTEGFAGLDACVTFQDNYVDYAPYIQRALNLPGFDPVGVDITCEKLRFRQTLQQEGTFGIIHACSLNDYLFDENVPVNLLNTMVVLKPTYGSGSAGVFLCSSKEDVIKKHHEYTSVHPKHQEWMVEEYISGPELGVELIIVNGTCVFSSLMECEKTAPPCFQGIGRFFPSRLAPAQQEQVLQECIRAAHYLHLDHGVIDIDVKYESKQGHRGPLILEINSRMGGNSVGFMHNAIFGIELVEHVLLCGCQMTVPPEIFLPKSKAAYAKMILAQTNGTLHNDINSQLFTTKLKEALGDASPLLTSARCTATSGAPVFGTNDIKDVPTILGVVVATGDTLDDAHTKVNLIHTTATLVLNSYVVPIVDEV